MADIDTNAEKRIRDKANNAENTEFDSHRNETGIIGSKHLLMMPQPINEETKEESTE